MEHHIIVTSAKNEVAWFRLRLLYFGLKEHGNGYSGTFFSQGKVNRIRAFCKKKHLHFAYDNAYGKRTGNYRAVFFRENPAKNGKYQCVYCGRRLRPDRVVVDHLYPIGRVSKSAKLQKKLQKQGILSVNDAKNLVASCARCNSKKGQKMGSWIRHGKRGRRPWYWPLRRLLRWISVSALIGLGVWVTFLLIRDPRKIQIFIHTFLRRISHERIYYI